MPDIESSTDPESQEASAGVEAPEGAEADLSDVEFETTDGASIPASNTLKTALIVAAGLGAVIVIAVLAFLFNGGDSTSEAIDAESVPAVGTQDDCDSGASCSETQPTEATGGTVADDCPPGSGCDAEDEASALQDTLSGFVSDPVGDLDRAYSDLDPIDGARTVDGVSGDDFMAAADVTGMEVTSSADDGETTISLTFDGPAQDVQSEEQGTLQSRSISGDVIITPPDGRILNVLLRPDGKIKISDIPAGMSITSAWATPEELQIVIVGLLLNPGTQVEAFMLLEAYGGFMSDVLSLALSGS